MFEDTAVDSRVSPSDMHVGAAYEFSVWHRMEITDPLSPFPIEMVTVEG